MVQAGSSPEEKCKGEPLPGTGLGRHMNSDDLRTKRCGFMVPQDLMIKFKEYISEDTTSIPKLTNQFMINYIDCLDPSFLVDPNSSLKRRGVKKDEITMAIPAVVYHQFKEKTIKDGVKMSRVLEQFIRNYVEFMDKRKAKG